MLFTLNKLRDLLVTHHQLHGYQWMESPLVDNAELFLERASDTVIPRLYTFEQHGRLATLRPEFTTNAMHQYVKAGLETPKRWQFFGETFDNAAGIPQQHLSAGIELINVGGVMADVEALLLAWEGARLLTDAPLTLHINHIGLLHAILQQFGLDDFVIRLLLTYGRDAIDTLLENSSSVPSGNSGDADADRALLDVLLDSTQYGTTMGGRHREEILVRLARKRQRQQQRVAIDKALVLMDHWHHSQVTATDMSSLSALIDPHLSAAHAILASWQLTIQRLVSAGIPSADIQIQLNTSQNWQYYTGIVFSITDGSHTLISGGRYDDLARSMNAAQPVPAIGFAYFLDNYLDRNHLLSVVNILAEHEEQALAVARTLRTAGIATVIGDDGSPSVGKVSVGSTGLLRLDGAPITHMNDLLAKLKARS